MKGKRLMALLLCFAAVGGTFATAGCDKEVQEFDESKSQLFVKYYNGGAGRAWIDEVVANFEADYADVSFEEGKKGVEVVKDFEKSIKEIKDVCDVKVYVQPSDELNLASACALSAIKAGADGVKTTLGVKYVSASVLADVIRAKKYDLGVDCAIDVTNVKSISDAINLVVNGEIEKEAEQKVAKGNIDGNTSIKDISEIIKQLGYELSDADLGNVYEEFKKLSTKKEVIDMKELEALIASTAMQVPSTYHLVNYVVNSGNIIPATANVTLEKDGEKFTGVSTGDGPIDAAFHAIEQVIGHHYELDDFQVHAVTKGRGAVGSSIIRLRADGKLYPGNGVSTDIVGACIRAYINALNKIVYEEN